jgi:hypothetical protein
MPLFGTLKSMPLPDLLQWLGNARRTGTLQVERHKISKSISFKDGKVVGCSSDDPPERLGQFLLSRGRITEEQLRESLVRQEARRQHLGKILVEMNVLSPDELSAQLEAKAEETIYSLFDWDDAVFRFDSSLHDEANSFPIGLRVEDVLLRGLKRFDEIQQIRSVFNDPGIVLCRTEASPPEEIFANRMARTLYEAIDGDRSVAQLLLHVHGSEFVVTKFLYELHRNRLVRIAGVKRIVPLSEQPTGDAEQTTEAGFTTTAAPLAEQPATPPAAAPNPAQTPEPSSVFDPAAPDQPPPVPSRVEGSKSDESNAGENKDGEREDEKSGPDDAPHLGEKTIEAPLAVDSEPTEDLLANWEPNVDLPPKPESPQASDAAGAEQAAQDPIASTELGAAAGDAPAASTLGTEPKGVESLEKSGAHRLVSQLEAARRRMSSGEFEEALNILDELYRQFPGDESLRRMTAEAEAAFAEKAYRHFLPPTKVPTLTRPMEELECENLSPSEFFLLSRIDGSWDIKSIIQIAPLREADALRTLKRMRENGVIVLHEAEPASTD